MERQNICSKMKKTARLPKYFNMHIMPIQRDFYLHQLIDGKQNGLIKIIIWIRRCGKSYLLFTLFYQYLKNIGVTEDHIIKIALDDIESADLRDPLALYKYIKAKMVDEDLYSYEYSFLYFCVILWLIRCKSMTKW